jgi:lipid-A-disaccharide synthase
MSTETPFRLPPAAAPRVDLLVIAGEHSGDQHAATMVRELKAKRPGFTVAALGGPELAKAGAQLLHDMTASSVVGFVEVLKNYPFFKALFAETLRWIAEHKPRAVCFVDYPGLNLRLAKALRERGLSVKGGGDIQVLYYISPQIWAWKAGRRFTMARDLDALAVIFPFEVECYKDTSLPVEFVGHPFLDEAHEAPVRYDPAGPILLLPGSRKQAVGRIFPVLLAGHAAYGKRDAVVVYPSELIKDVLLAAKPPANVKLVPTGAPVAASAVLMSSGTMSMHCALAAIPGAVAYLGIANLLLKEPMYPEYIQGAATPQALAAELSACLGKIDRLIATQTQADKLRALLRRPAGGTVADWVLRKMA